MLKKFVSGLGVVLALNLLVKPIWIFLIDLTVQNRLGPEVYGEYFALLNFTFLWNILLDVGITNFNNKAIAQNQDLLSKHFPKIISLRLIMGGVYLLVCGALGVVFGYSSEQLVLIAWLAANQFLSLLILFLRSNLSGLMMFKLDAVFSVLDRFVMTLMMAGILFLPWFTDKLSIEVFIGVQTLAYLLSVGVLLIVLLRKLQGFKKAWHWPFKLAILKKSFPYAVLVLLMILYTRTDAVMLERMVQDGARESGIYARSFRLLESLNMIAFLFAGLLLPIFSTMIPKKERVQTIAGLAFRVLFSGAWIAIFVMMNFGEWVMGQLYAGAGAKDGQLVAGLMWAFMGMASTYVFGTLLTANGNLRILNQMAMAGVLVNIGLNFVLIPTYGALGAVGATIVTQLGSALFQVYLCNRYFPFRFSEFKPWRTIGFLLAVPLGVNLVYSWDQNMVGFLSALALGLILVFATRMISIPSLKTFIQLK